MVQTVPPSRILATRDILFPSQYCYVMLEREEYWLLHNYRDELVSILWITSEAYLTLEYANKTEMQLKGVDGSGLKEYVNRSYKYIDAYKLARVHNHVPFIFPTLKMMKLYCNDSGRLVISLLVSQITSYLELYVNIRDVPNANECIRCRNRERRRLRRLCGYCVLRRRLPNVRCPWNHNDLLLCNVTYVCSCTPPKLCLECPVFGSMVPFEYYLPQYTSMERQVPEGWSEA